MGIITESELLEFGSKDYVSAFVDNNKYKALFESKNKDVDFTRIFLSHKHGETREINAARKLLESEYSKIYLDWEDEEMPNFTSGETAHKIKSKILSSDKVVLLGTEEAIKSPWCNWELGFSDMIKFFKNNLAILPVKKDNHKYEGNEYLQIYPYIQKHEYNESLYEVKFPDGSHVWLDDWLKK